MQEIFFKNLLRRFYGRIRGMFPRKIKVCDAFGIPVYLDFSLIILLALFVMSFGSFAFGLSCALVLALSIVAHELGHALTARCFGFRTRDITLSLLGWCASLIAMPRKAWQELLTALAGPLMSFALCGFGYGMLALGTIESHYVGFVFAATFWMNMMLGAFNLLPGFPMDGGRVFRSIMRAFMSRAKATYIAMVVGRIFAVLLGLRGLHSIMTGGGWGFVSILIALMIWREGWREYQMARMEEGVAGWSRDWSARVSPPPYGGDEDEVEIKED